MKAPDGRIARAAHPAWRKASSPAAHPALRRWLSAAFMSIALLAPGTAAANDNPRIIPIDARFHGLSYGEWLAKFNQWFLGVPASDNASLIGNEDTLAVGQPKHVWFLSNTVPVADRHFVVPPGTALWVTIFAVEWDNYFCVEPDTNFSVDELRAIAKEVIDQMTDIEVTIDGRRVENVDAYRMTSPVFSAKLPADNVLQTLGCADALPGTYPGIVADGRALLLAPLHVGEHTIRITARVIVDPSDPAKNVDVDITWRISVVPGTH